MGPVGRTGPEGERLVETSTRGQELGELPGSGGVVALVGQVGADDDVADAHEPGDRARRPRVERALLDATVDGVEQVGRWR